MSEAEIAPARLADCLAVTMDALQVERDAIERVAVQTGGLFNFLLRVETSQGTYFFKQYLDGVPNPIFDLPTIPASTRSQLARQVQELAASAVQPWNNRVVPEILHFDRERNAFLMPKAPGDRPFIELLAKGERSEAALTQLPRMLACLHRSTAGKHSGDALFANVAFRDFKLKIQYDDIAARLSPDEAECVMRCKHAYQARAECVTHGDINSRNILVGEGELGVIDFEQSHLGAPAYDLAYILCEILISQETFGSSATAHKTICEFLDVYFEYFGSARRAEIEREITPHLAIQTLYRFWGPSRNSWTFYVEDPIKERILRRARALLKASAAPVRSALES